MLALLAEVAGMADAMKNREPVVFIGATLQMLSDKGVVHVDEERKAQMVSNLLVVLCSERSASPVVNAGSIFGLRSGTRDPRA